MWIKCNPNPLGKQTGDCVVRAIAIATGQSWRDTYRELCKVGIVRHASGDIFRELAGIPFRGGLKHTFQKDAGGAFRDGFHSIDDTDTEPAELAFIDGRVFTIASEPVNLPGDDGII